MQGNTLPSKASMGTSDPTRSSPRSIAFHANQELGGGVREGRERGIGSEILLPQVCRYS